MSTTLALMLHHLEPGWSIAIIERLEEPGRESSDTWNNSGTGHAALCEFNYTPQDSNGTVSIKKALEINEQFQVSRQFWSFLVMSGAIPDPAQFIRPVPHMSVAFGRDQCAYLRQRVSVLESLAAFDDLEQSDDPAVLKRWLPLMFEGRPSGIEAAVSRSQRGTDVDFGTLTRLTAAHLARHGVDVIARRSVVDVCLDTADRWTVVASDRDGHQSRYVAERFLFLGTGGGSLPLLQRARIPSAKNLGGFPISGLFLRTSSPELVAGHTAKVYGQADPGAPSISIPHLDKRHDGPQQYLSFGPFATFSPRFLKNGSPADFPRSLRPRAIPLYLSTIRDNPSLVSFTVKQLLARDAQRFTALQHFVPTATPSDWELIVAGQRVQVIRRTKGRAQIVTFGTEVIASEDGQLASLLGASPGASAAPAILLDLIQQCFREDWRRWLPKIREMVPTVGVRLADDAGALRSTMARTDAVLRLS